MRTTYLAGTLVWRPDTDEASSTLPNLTALPGPDVSHASEATRFPADLLKLFLHR